MEKIRHSLRKEVSLIPGDTKIHGKQANWVKTVITTVKRVILRHWRAEEHLNLLRMVHGLGKNSPL